MEGSPCKTSPCKGSPGERGGCPHCAPPEVNTEYSMHELRRLKRNLEERRDLFRFCADYYSRLHYMLVVPSSICTILAGGLATVWPSDYYPHFKEVAIAVLCGVAAILQGVNNQFRFQSKMDIFMNSAQLMDSLQYKAGWRIVFNQQHAVTDEALEQLGGEIATKVLEVRESAPPIPLWLEAKADRAREKFKITDKSDANYKNMNFDENGNWVGNKNGPAYKSPEKIGPACTTSPEKQGNFTTATEALDAALESGSGTNVARALTLKNVPKPSEVRSITPAFSGSGNPKGARRSLFQSKRKDASPSDPEAQRARLSTGLHYFGQGHRHAGSPYRGSARGGDARGGGARVGGGARAGASPERCPAISRVTPGGAAG